MRSSLGAAFGLALVLSFVVGHIDDARAEETEKSFARDLARCRSYLGRERWKVALERYRKLLEDHAERRWIYPKLDEIEAELRECAFRQVYEEPDGPGLFGEAAVGYSARARHVKLQYKAARGHDDWPGDAARMACRHPFEGSILVETIHEGAAFHIRICWDLGTSSGYSVNVEDGGIWRYDAGHPTYLGQAPKLPYRREHRVGVRRVRGKIEISRDGRKLDLLDRFGEEATLVVDDKYNDGLVVLSGAGEFAVRIAGTLQKDPLDKLIVEYRRRTYASWLADEWNREAELPKWAWKGPGGAPLDIALPKGAGEREALLSDIVSAWLSDDDAGCRALGARLDDAAVEATAATQFARAIVALASGSALNAHRLAGESVVADEDFGPAYAVRGLAACRLRRDPRADVEAARARCDAGSPWPALVESEWMIYERDLEAALNVLTAAQTAGARGTRFERRLAAVTAAHDGLRAWDPRHMADKTMRVEGNVEKEEFERLTLVTYRAVVKATAWFPLMQRGGPPMRLRIIEDLDAFAGFARRFRQNGSGRIVLLLSDVRELIVWAEAPVERLLPAVRSECVVWVLRERVDDPPRWFERGHAVFASLEDLEAAHPLEKRAELRKVLRLTAASPTSIEVLTTLNHEEFDADAARHDAESFALVHFLRTTKAAKYSELAEAYFEGLAAGRSAVELTSEYFAPIREALQAALAEHVERLTSEK